MQYQPDYMVHTRTYRFLDYSITDLEFFEMYMGFTPVTNAANYVKPYMKSYIRNPKKDSKGIQNET